MTSNSKSVSTAQLRCTNIGLELRPQDNPTSTSGQGTAPVQGVLAMECTDTGCKSGTQPLVATPVLDMQIQITQSVNGQPCILATPGGPDTWTSIPILDGSYEAQGGTDACKGKQCAPSCGGLCEELAARRNAAQLPPGTTFYVYRINQASGELASLKDKLIAIPVPSGQASHG